MTYFTDKAFPSTFLHKARGLHEMIVKKEEDNGPLLEADLKHKYEDKSYKRYEATKREE